ncbi:MAG: hypothetical protein ACXWIU_12390 [Limisphaerales bacterium]
MPTYDTFERYDEVVFARLRRALGDLQYPIRDQWNGVAAFQDLRHWAAVGFSGPLKIASESYVGLSVEGLSLLIADLNGSMKKTFDGPLRGELGRSAITVHPHTHQRRVNFLLHKLGHSSVNGREEILRFAPINKEKCNSNE